MNRTTIFLLGCLIMASCTVNRYYIVGDGNNTEDITRLVSGTKKNAGAKATKSTARISYDESLPDVPRPSLISKSPVYNPQDKHTFPVYGNETAVIPPKNTTPEKTVAIWCTKECTLWPVCPSCSGTCITFSNRQRAIFRIAAQARSIISRVHTTAVLLTRATT